MPTWRPPDSFTIQDANIETNESISLTAAGKSFGFQSGAKIYSGSADPESAVTAVVGCLYLRTSVGLYWKAVGTGNTGWVALQSLSTSPTAGIGYATGAGGAVTQGSGSGKATGVTLSKVCGQITMDAAALNAGVAVSFTLTNTAIAATDILSLNHASVGNVGDYVFSARCAAGSATITVRNVTAGNLSEAIVIGFALTKSVTA